MSFLNPLPTNDAYICIMSSHKPIRIYMGGLVLGVNTLYRLFCFFKLFPMVGKGLIIHQTCTALVCRLTDYRTAWKISRKLNQQLEDVERIARKHIFYRVHVPMSPQPKFAKLDSFSDPQIFCIYCVINYI